MELALTRGKYRDYYDLYCILNQWIDTYKNLNNGNRSAYSASLAGIGRRDIV